MESAESDGAVVSRRRCHRMRCIIHLDMDCFYAQVEAARRGVPPDRPLGVRQASLLVTCNYAARERGLRKCMPASEAVKECPDLLVVPGEDLRPYKVASERVHDALKAFGLPVERAGLDENYVDVTERVNSVEGDDAVLKKCGCPARDHAAVVAGARLAEDMRAAVRKEVGLTCCAGVAHTKALAKLVGAARKPDSATAIYPCEGVAFLSTLESVSRLPGVGPKTSQTLRGIGVGSVVDLQACPLTVLERSLGRDAASRLKKLSLGADTDEPVAPRARPDSLAVEVSFRPTDLMREVESKLDSLARRLMASAEEDGRLPGGVRVTVRRRDSARNVSHRQTRQRRLPGSLFRVEGGRCAAADGAHSQIVKCALELFRDTVDMSRPFHITLLGLAFVKLKDTGHGRGGGMANYLLNDVSVHSVTDLRNDAPPPEDAATPPAPLETEEGETERSSKKMKAETSASR